MSASCESRNELITWLNDLLHLNIAKVEQVGTGAPLCQIFDSIYGDVPLHRVKFTSNQEFEYVHNFKVLQEAFIKHNIDRHIPVDRLIKMRFQDNLEFLQWVKKYWDANFPGGNYDAIKRRGGRGVPDSPVRSQPVRKAGATLTAPTRMAQSQSPVKKPAARAAPPAAPAAVMEKSPSFGLSSSAGNASMASMASLDPNASSGGLLAKTITELRITIDEMEKERDFYFSKLRDIEILTQRITEPEMLQSDFFKQVTEILYTTEDGFEVPADCPPSAPAMSAMATNA